MNRLLLCLTCAISLLLALTSCEVHLFSQSYDLPWYVVVPLTIAFIVLVILWTGYRISHRSYRCTRCGKTFYPPWHGALISIHMGERRVFRCPHCGHKGFCSPTQDE